MARDWKTTYSASAAAAVHTAPFPAPTVSGRALVAFAAAPATIALPGGWNEVADPLGDGELAAAVHVAGAGESQLTWSREAGQSVAQRALAGWVDSRDDLSGTVHAGTVQQYATASADGGQLELAPLVTTVDGCRIYVAISTVRNVGSWAPTWSAPVTAEDTIVVTGLEGEPVRLSVASGVVAAGSYTITISGLPNGQQTQIVAFAVEPGQGEPPEEAPEPETEIEAENRLTGTAKAVWDITGAGSATIQGFATSTHVDRGQALTLKVHSPASAWTGTVYRLGYYGGDGAREIDTITGPQTTQPNGTVDSTTLMVSCANWTANGSWTPPADSVPGLYLIKVARDDNAALASHIGPFVVHNPARKAAIAVKLSDSTWQAYNHAGANPADPFAGRSVYGTGTAGAFTFDQAQRARAASYDRPLVTRLHLPQTSFWNAEYPLVRWLERLGYDVDYLSCAQVDAAPTLLLDRSVVISSGHDEYWSAGMHAAFAGARDHSTLFSHALYLSGNEAFWRIRWDGGRRSFACWKDTHDNALNSTGLYSGTWQDTRGMNTDRRPAALLNGQRFRLNGLSAYAMRATAAHASSPLWRDTAVAALTGSQTWTSPVGIVGFEADEPADTAPTEHPAGLLRLSQASYAVTDMLADDNGNLYNLDGTYTHALTAYRAATGAVVVAAGTVQYAWALDETHDRHPGGTIASPALQQALTNLLADLGELPPEYPFPEGLVLPEPVGLDEYGFPDVPPPDTTPPSAPTGLQATPGQTQIALAWTASTDNVGVDSYEVLRGGTLVASGITATGYTVTGLTAGTSYTLGVRAVDAAGNSSTLATISTATTSPEPDPDPEVVPGAYATIAQLHDHIGRTPDNARTLLIRASRVVDRALLCAVYDPAAAAVQTALRDAVLEQIAGQLESGDQNGLGVARPVQSFTIGKLNVQRSGATASAPTTGGLVDQAYAILQQAGLTGHGPREAW